MTWRVNPSHQYSNVRYGSGSCPEVISGTKSLRACPPAVGEGAEADWESTLFTPRGMMRSNPVADLVLSGLGYLLFQAYPELHSRKAIASGLGLSSIRTRSANPLENPATLAASRKGAVIIAAGAIQLFGGLP